MVNIITWRGPLRVVLVALALAGNAAHGGSIPGATPPPVVPPITFPPPPCPPNSSCVPGVPPILPPVTPPGTCGPGSAGAACAGAGAGPATSAASGTGLNVGAGNPINIITGNKHQREVDMAPLPGVLGLEIVRHYNSVHSGVNHSTNLIGRGWKLSYETELSATGNTLQIVQADGSRIIFNRDKDNAALCSSANPADGSVTVRKGANGEQFVWRWVNGRELSFDSRGKLVQILAPGGQFVSLQHDARGLLVSVIDPQGRRLQLKYLDKQQAQAGTAFRGVQSIISPVGTFAYAYGSSMPRGASVAAKALLANLVKVSMPTGARHYHYDSAQFPTYLTGISELASDAGGKIVWQRVATYGYDSSGKGNLSVKGAPARLARGADGKLLAPARLAAGTGVEQITLEHGAGHTTLTNSLGQKTVYRHAIIGGQYRLTDARGPGCASCGETNVSYGYDKEGRLSATMKLDAKGAVVSAESTQYDALGRARLLTSYPYANGKPLAGQWKMRFEYAGNSASPSRIARPSVVAGREHLTVINYVEQGAAQGLVATVTERGFLPTYDGKGSAGHIERSIAYRYDGYGQRTETDGPLPNAAGKADPSNSDITQTLYDARTKMPVRSVTPGNVVTEFVARDTALRLTVLRTADAAGTQTVTIRNNWRGQPEELRIDSTVAGSGETLSRTIRYGYGPNGRLLSLAQPGNLTSRYVYDAAGRMTHRILPDGSTVASTLDSESQQQQLALYNAEARLAALTAFRFDARGRAAGSSDQLGTLGAVGYTHAGQVAELTNALGIATHFAYDAQGQMLSVTNAAGTADASTIDFGYDVNGKKIAVTDANGVATRRRYDDFGRKMFEVNGDRGVILFFYDAAGRLLVRSDGAGGNTRYTYNLQGHLLSVGSDKVAGLVQYRYLGRRLVEVFATPDGKPEHATERTTYRHDAIGQVLEERRTMARVDTAPGSGGLLFVTATEYDEAGRVLQQKLPDGHRLAYRYGKVGGQLEAILFDGEPVVRDIRQSIAAGLQGYTSVNGVRQNIVHDARGRVTQLDALAPGATQGSGLARIMAWFGKDDSSAPRVLYSQTNGYDAGDRLTVIGRRLSAAGQGAAQVRTEHYGYDRLDRLISIADSDGARTGYAYDKGGNRTEEQSAPVLLTTGGQRSDAPVARGYLYAQGTNRLIGVTGAGGAQSGRAFESGLFYNAGGLPMAQIAFAPGATLAPAHRRVAYNNAKRPVAVFGANNEMIAAYYYNASGERSAKTVFPAAVAGPGIIRTAALAQQSKGVTTYSLYRDQRLAAEADSDGRIRAHYVYLQGKPVAKIEMGADSGLMRRLWKSVTGAERGAAHVYAIHTDHLGTPQAVSGVDGAIVWQARTSAVGQASIMHTALSEASGQPFQMNLRLPGQVFDAETGLSQNYYRDYDARLGRYTTPDPLGLEGGINPFAYVDSNPLTRIDPLGLYQSDVHYYMTMFLGIAAGMSVDEARIVALAAQWIDDNPLTRPLNLSAGLSDAHRTRLLTYHFTMVPSVVDASTGLIKGGVSDYGAPTTDTNYANLADNPQLANLANAVTRSQTDGNVVCQRGARLQLMGEYIHTFADGFSHRNSNDRPFSLEIGIAHGLYFSHPDYTYNHLSATGFPGGFNWNTNEARTLQMERELYVKLQTLRQPGSIARPFSELEGVLRAFNGIHEHEGSGYEPGEEEHSEKIRLLQGTLNSWGVTGVNWTGAGAPTNRYSQADGAANRNKFLCTANGSALDQTQYQGTILPICNGTVAPEPPVSPLPPTF